MKIRLYLDEDTQRSGLLNALRRRDVDVLTAAEAVMLGAPDPEQVAFAARLGRALYTFNRSDFQRLHTEYMLAGWHHAGLIVALQQR